jgi:hypothetical protein
MRKESNMHDTEATRLGQIAYAAYHGRPLPIDGDEWPPGDKIVQRWEAVGRALRDATKVEPAQPRELPPLREDLRLIELTDERIGQIWDSVSEEEHDGVSWDAVKAFALAIRDMQVAIPGEARFNTALAYADQVARGCIDDGKRHYIIQAARNAWIKGALAATPPQAQDQEQQG